MKESAEIPLNPIISSSLDNNSGSERLINYNSNISTNIYNYSPINSNIQQVKKKTNISPFKCSGYNCL